MPGFQHIESFDQERSRCRVLSRQMKLRSSDDLFREANRRLPAFLAEYVNGGSYAEHTLRRNVADLAAIELRQRVLNDVSNIDLKATLFGTEWSLPVGLGPIGISGMFARRGEVQAATAAEQANIPFCLSTVNSSAVQPAATARSSRSPMNARSRIM